MRNKIRNILTDEKGQVGLFAAFAVVVVLGVAAITIDFGYLSLQRRELQNIADSAALAGAWELPYEADAITKAQEYIDLYLDEDEKDNLEVSIDPNRYTGPEDIINDSDQLRVYLNNGYERWFSRIFGDALNRVDASATARILQSANLDLLPIADIDLYKDPDYSDNQGQNARTDLNDPFHYYALEMEIDEYFEFIESRIYGKKFPEDIPPNIKQSINADGNREYYIDIKPAEGEEDKIVRKIERTFGEITEIITVEMSIDFAEPGGELNINYESDLTEDVIAGINGYEDIPNRLRYIGDSWMYLWGGPSTRGNLGWLNLSAYISENPSTLGLQIEGLDLPIFDSEDSEECIHILPEISPFPGTNQNTLAANADYIISRFEEDYQGEEQGTIGIVLAVLPSAAEAFRGSSIPIGDDEDTSEIERNYIMIYGEHFDLVNSSEGRYIELNMKSAFKIIECDLPEITTSDREKMKVNLVQ